MQSHPHPQRLPAFRRAAALLVVAVAIVSATTDGAAASAQTQGVRLDVRRGIDGISRAYSPNPLTIVAESDRFFSGWIEVVAPNNIQATSRYRQALELPAGTRKTITMVTPRSTINAVRAINSEGRVEASAQIPGDKVLRSGEPFVGVLSQDAPRLASVDIPILRESARVVPVDGALLSLGWAGISALSHLVVDGPVLDALSETQRTAITSFAVAGGEVIVAATEPSEVASIGEDIAGPADSVRSARVGSGRITAVMTPLADAGWNAGGALWRETLRPVDVNRWSRGASRNQALGQALRETGGFRRPTLGWLLFFVLAYVALVGPLNFMVLSRIRRRELAWVTIPAVAVVFSMGAYVAGLGFRDIPNLQGVAVRVFENGGENTEIALGVVPRRGTEASVRLSGSWTAEPYSAVSGRGEGQRIEFGRDRVTARFDLSSGEVGTIVASRNAPRPELSAGRVRLERNEYKGSITNPLGSALEGPRLFVGTASVELGEALPAGRSREATLGLFNTDGSSLAGANFDGGFREFGGEEALAQPPSLYRRAGVIAGLGRPGYAFLTGWVPLEQAREALGMDGAKGNALVLVPVEIDDPSATPPAQAVRATVVGTDGEFNDVGGFDGFGGGPQDMIQNARRTVLRFDMPGGVKPHRVRLTPHGPNPWGGNRPFVKRRAAVREGNDDPVFRPRRGDPIVIQPQPDIAVDQPDIAVDQPGIANAGMSAQAYDLSTRRWVDLTPRNDGTIVVATNGSRRYFTDDGEIYIRVLNDFGEVLTSSMFTLEGVSA